MKDYLHEEYDIELHFNDLDYTINGKRFYIYHGDGLAKHDKGYRFLKKIFRNRVNIFLYSLLHPDIGIPLARGVSALSRGHTQGGGPPYDADYIQAALDKFEQGFDYAIFGHLHSPKFQPFGQKAYLNLGDWIENFTYAEFDGESLSLKHWI